MNTERISSAGSTDRPIPTELPQLAGWKEVKLVENGEPLVPLGIFSEIDEIFTHSIYFGEKEDSPYPSESLEGSLITMFVRREVAEQLKKAQELLPSGMHLVVFDAYRTLQVQQSHYGNYLNELKKLHPDWTNEQLAAETQKYVSIPLTDPAKPSPHNTGGAVDLAIYKLPKEVEDQVQEINIQVTELGEKDWAKAYQLEMKKLALVESNMKLLDFGTPFDYGGSKASLNYFEKLAQERQLTSQEQEAQRNRRILYNVMMEVGFAPYEDEWWHYNSKKSQMGAKVANLDHAEYGAMQLDSANQKQEMVRRMHWLGSIKIYNGDFGSKLGIYPLTPEMVAAKQGVTEIGDIRKTKSPLAAVIKPVGQAA